MVEENMVQTDVGVQSIQPSYTTWSETADELMDSNYEDIDVNAKSIQIFGSQKQRQEMFTSWAKYFLEVTNPENTVVNTFFKAKYSPLNEVLNTVRPILGKYGFGIFQAPSFNGTDCFVNTILTHESGAFMSFPALTNKPTKQDVQGMGSTLTYLRRFALNSIAGVMGEVDDDGNAAAGSGNKDTNAKQESARKPETSHDKLRDLCRNKMSEAKKVGKDQEMRSKLDEITKGINGLTEDEAKKAIEEVNKL